MSWNDIRENLEALDISQRLVTRWAAVRRTPTALKIIRRECEAFEQAAREKSSEEMIWSNWRFHAAIAEACGNSSIERFYKFNLTLNLRITRLAMTREHFFEEMAYTAHVANILREHREILMSIEKQNADAAERLAQSHTDLARRVVIDRLVQSITPSMNLNLSEAAERR
jgi:DNA-binding GntR family transcriptional regulator